MEPTVAAASNTELLEWDDAAGNALCANITKVQDVPPAMCDTVDHGVKSTVQSLVSRSCS